MREVEGEPGVWGRRASETWGAAERERAARWLTSRAALSVGCVRAVRVGLERREGESACWARRGGARPTRAEREREVCGLCGGWR